MANIGGHRPKRAKTLHHIEVKEGENGGHVMTHHFESAGEYHPPEEHVFGKNEGRAAAAHVIKHMGMDVSKQLSDGENHDEGDVKQEEEGD